MSVADQTDKPIPTRQPGPPALAHPEVWDEIPEVTAPAAAKVLNTKVVLRAARRHWWKILVLWGLLSGGLMFLAYHKINISYEATALLIVRSTAPPIYEPGTMVADIGRFQKTQVDLVTSSDVLADTLATHPDLTKLPLLQESEDPEADIRKALRVQIRPETSLITVSLSSEDRKEAVDIVDDVVEAYLKSARNWADDESREQIKRLKDERDKIKKDIEDKKTKLAGLIKSRGIIDMAELKDQGKLSLERFQSYLANWDGIRWQRISLEAELEVAKLRAGRAVPKVAQQAGPEQLRQAFYEHPAVAALVKEKNQAQTQFERARRLTKKVNDPTLMAAEKRVKELMKEIEKKWHELQPVLQKDLLQEGQLDESEKIVQDLENRLNAAKNTENAAFEMLNKMEIDNKAAGNDALQVQFAQAELSTQDRLLMSIQSHIQQIEFDAKGPAKVERANNRTRVDPSTNKRLRVMAATPVGVLALVLSLFVMFEVRSGRVADPDELPSRVRVEVIGVVPPLPSLRPSRALWGSRDEIRARRQLEEFVQSLDHLRVALCAHPKGSEARRCVLITSACSSEGKTTLAAHLAGRCANAGLSTLLIDADLRNPSLSRLLKVPDGPGLSDILRGEATAEGTMMVIEAGGGFHLLPAGTPGHDPSRILQGDQLAQLLGQLRQAFDIIIMDAPPVLLVPDALTVGRCTDGALLAVRYDTSRFTLVERAHRRLTAVGVPIIGAVVNGVRTMESSYGYYSYSYAYHSGRPSTGTATIDVPAEPTT
jgi:polysaccharide biosynthesis transport protein